MEHMQKTKTIMKIGVTRSESSSEILERSSSGAQILSSSSFSSRTLVLLRSCFDSCSLSLH
jgi:hypothetical protein